MGNASHSSATKFNGSPQGTNICDHLFTWLNLTRLIYLFLYSTTQNILLHFHHITDWPYIYTFKTIQSNPPLGIIHQIQYFHSCNGTILSYISDNYFYHNTIVSSSGLAQSTQNIWNTLYSRRILCNPGLLGIIPIQDGNIFSFP